VALSGDGPMARLCANAPSDLTGMGTWAGVRKVLYKDEASRFGLGSFKALGGAYAVACLLKNMLSQQLNRTASTSELTSPAYADWIRGVTVACASDGNHGRSVAAGAKRVGCGCTIFLYEGVSVRHYRARRLRYPHAWQL
jgi:diaminopropionate ammonia-lyase